MRKKSDEKDFFYVHLPIDEDFHLEFPLIKQKQECQFIYTTCDRCKDLEEHGFPEICLRRSVYFQEDAPKMYDNRISINHQSLELIKKSYETLEDFIINCII
jgi:hypothetical protein